jgi:hypothetical protein
MSDLHKINAMMITAKSTEASIGIIQLDTSDAVMKFEITEDLAHLICTKLERFLTRRRPDDPPMPALLG